MRERIKSLQSIIRRSCMSRSANIAIWWALVCKCWHHRANSRAFCGDQCRKRGLGSTVCAATVHCLIVCFAVSQHFNKELFLSRRHKCIWWGPIWMNECALILNDAIVVRGERRKTLCHTGKEWHKRRATFRALPFLVGRERERGSWNRVTLSSPVEWRDFFITELLLFWKICNEMWADTAQS